jgi:hypothetical protein
MADTVKRLNYFDHQFLRRQDFADEQAYHLAQRRTHNRLLHTPGVAGGLELKLASGGRQLVVGEGVAVDAQGREIVLAADSAPIDLAPSAGKTVYVTLAYAEREIDPSAETGVQGNRRVEEAPDIQLTTDAPANAGLTLVLGRVKVDKDGTGTADAGEGAARRRAAGGGGGEFEARLLTFASDGVAASQWPSLRMAAAATVEVRGSLSVTEDTFTRGSLGVGTTTPAARLQVMNVPQDSNGNSLILGPTNASNLRLGYHADYSWIQSHGLKPLRINEIGNDIVLNRAGNARVGVGTDPGAQLHVSRNLAVGPVPVGDAPGRLDISGSGGELSLMDRAVTKFGGKAGERFVLYTSEMRLRAWTPERGDLLNLTLDGRLSLGGAAGPQQLNLTGGIGFANQNAADKRLWSPADGLLRWQTHNSAGTHAFEVGHQDAAAAVHLDTAGPSWLTGGWLGIGRANPAAALHVEAKDTQLVLGSPDAGARVVLSTEGGKSNWDFGIGGGRAGARDYWIGDGRSVHLAIADGTGFTGLGTAKPEARLHVVGDVRIDGKLIARDGVPGATQWAGAGGGISYTGASTFVDVGEGDMPFRVRTKSGAVGYLETSGNNAFLRIATSEGIGNRVELCNRPGGRLALWTGGAGDVVNVTRDGKVGFKKTDPTHEFHVLSDDGALALFETKANSAALRVSTSEGMDNRVELCNRSGGRLALWTAGAADAFNITRDGKFGFRTTAPTHEFHVYNNDGAVGLFETKQNNAYLRISTSEGIGNRVEVCNRPGGRLALWTGSDVLSVTRGAMVGIGIDAPEVKLHVVGGPVGPGGGTLILGPTTASNLRLGYDTEYSWIQSHGSKPLRINQLGNNVTVGDLGATPVQFHVRRGIACGPWARPDAAEGRIECTGPVGELSFAKRTLTSWPASPQRGDRYLWYNQDGIARLWTEPGVNLVHIDGNGNMTLEGWINAKGGKIGYVVDHFLNATGEALEEGDVVVVSGTQPAAFYGVRDNVPVPEVDLTDIAGDPRVCGIVAQVHDGGGETLPGSELGEAPADEPAPAPKRRGKGAAAAAKAAFDPTRVATGQRGAMVTLGAFSHCKVDAQYGAIQPGDLLMASPTRGHAQKVTDRAAATGCIVGKALAALEKGTAKIPVMVLLQ